MKASFFSLFIFLLFSKFTTKDQIIPYKGKEVPVTIQIGERFIGTYKGKGKGFLTLNADGTGTYRYDFQVGKCANQSFAIRWGFIKDENEKPVSFNREYGTSLPILLQSMDGNRFRGCQEEVMLDWILVKKDGIHISSSDDWKK